MENINNLLAHYAKYGDAAKSDKFDVLIPLPNKLGVGDFKSRELSLQCEGAEIPGVEINTIEYRHYGFTKRIPHHLSYQPISLTFYCNSEMMEKKLFDSWISLCVRNADGLVEYRQEDNLMNYETNITVNQYNQAGQVRYRVQAFEAFPTSVSSMPMNWADDQIHRVTVTFAYTKLITAADKAELASDPLEKAKFTNYTNIQAILGNAQVLAPTVLKKILRNNL